MSKSKRGKKARTLWVTRDGAADSARIWLGKPTWMVEDCGECGHQRDSWSAGRGCRLLIEEICLDGFDVSGIKIPAYGGIRQFKITEVE